MTRTSILSVIAAVAFAPAVVAQAPAPLPEGVTVTTRAFINGKEVTPEEAQKLMQGVIVRTLGREVAPAVAPAPEPPKPAEPCCSNPDCTCGPAPKPCECKPGAVCGPQNTPAPTPKPAPTAAPAPAGDADTTLPPGVKIIRLRPARPAEAAKPAEPAKSAAPTCPKCGKSRLAPSRSAGEPPCGKALPFDKPEMTPLPPCTKLHGKVVRPAVQVRRIERPAPPSSAVESPKAVKVIINGVEAIVPVKPEGVNITIKPL